LKIASKVVLILSLSLVFLTASAEPPNLGLLRAELVQYHDSGTYNKELAEVISKAEGYVKQQVEENKQRPTKQKLALVLDIDETSLSSYDYMAKQQFAGDEKFFNDIILAADEPAIKPTLELYQAALKQGVEIFFITGRHESFRAATEANLLRAGYTNWSGIYFKPDDYTDPSNVPFKEKTRAEINEKGYVILASIGDQYCDLLGGHANRVYKLPNPYYFLP